MIPVLLILFHLLVFGTLIWYFSKRYKSADIYPYFWPALTWKMILAGVAGYFALQVIPEGGDSWLFFVDANTLAGWAHEDGTAYVRSFFCGVPPDISELLHLKGQPRAVFMAQLLSPLSIISNSNYVVMAGYLTLLSFMGCWMVANNISLSYPNVHKAAVMSFLFVPSTVFWSAGISKETLFMAGWGLVISWTWPYFKNFPRLQLWRVGFLLIIILILIKLKYYYMAVTLPVIIVVILVHLIWSSKNNLGIRWLLLFIPLFPLFTWLHPNLNLQSILLVIKDNADQILSISSPTAVIHYVENQNAISWALINAPLALITALFRPFWTDLGSFWQNLTIVENSLIAIIGLGALPNLRRLPWHTHWWWPVIVYIFLLAILLALANPNFGTLARYKVVFTPLWVLLLLANNKWWKRITEGLP